MQRCRDLALITRASQAMARRIDECAYDVVFANPCQVSAVPAVLQFLATPSVYFLHEPVGRALIRQPRLLGGTANRLRTWADRIDPLIRVYQRRLDALQLAGLRRATRLLANSAFTKAKMAAAYGIDAPICRYGVDASVFRPVPEITRQNHVLSVGELSPRKGFDFLVESLALVPQARRPWLSIVCNTELPSERAYVEQLAAKRGVSLHIQVGLGSEALAREYNRAALCVYAPVQEPFGLVPLEAMACGTPVVGVREGGVQESILHDRTGLLVSRDTGAFANAVQQLMADPARRAEYSRNARAHVLAHWTWDQSVMQLECQLAAVRNEVIGRFDGSPAASSPRRRIRKRSLFSARREEATGA
jgi:glycosyltransferase involved in cell wall biosynthesis